MKNDGQPIRDSVPWNSRYTKDPRWLNNVFIFSTEIWAEQLKKNPVEKDSNLWSDNTNLSPHCEDAVFKLSLSYHHLFPQNQQQQWPSLWIFINQSHINEVSKTCNEQTKFFSYTLTLFPTDTPRKSWWRETALWRRSTKLRNTILRGIQSSIMKKYNINQYHYGHQNIHSYILKKICTYGTNKGSWLITQLDRETVLLTCGRNLREFAGSHR